MQSVLHCCVHNMSPFISSSGFSPGSREAKVQRAKSASIARSQVWLGLPAGRFQLGGTCRIAAARARWWSSRDELRAVWPKRRMRLVLGLICGLVVINSGTVVVADELLVRCMDQQTASYVGCLLVLTVSLATCTVPWHLINLPDEHVPYYFFRRPKLNDLCRKSPDCPYQVHMMLMWLVVHVSVKMSSSWCMWNGAAEQTAFV